MSATGYGALWPNPLSFDQRYAITFDRVPRCEIEIRRASVVSSSNDKRLGRVSGFLVRRSSCRAGSTGVSPTAFQPVSFQRFENRAERWASRRTITVPAVPAQPKKVTVVVADDHPLYREGVVRALAASGQVNVVAEAEDGRSALLEIQQRLPDVALLDYKLPELDGVAITNAVIRERLPTRVLLISAFSDSGVVYKALETGAAGFVPKEARREQIVDAVLACARGEKVVPAEVGAGLVDEIRLRRQSDTPALTPREQEILHLIASGKSLPEIAKELYLGLTTVKTHVQHLYEKLGVSDRAAAVATAMRRGLIE
jgi:two-component system nitrate/nitrite response regulator NarL